MDPTRTITDPPAAGPTTRPWPADAGEAMRVAPAAGTDPLADEELRTLLRKRLRFVGTLASVVGSFGSAIDLLEVVVSTAPPRITTVTLWVVTAVIALTSAVLWSRTRLTLPQLRAAELILFGLPAALLANSMPFVMNNRDYLARFKAASPLLIALFTIANWVVLVVAYGVLIPNTGRRSAWVVGVLAAAPVVLHLVSGLAVEEGRDQYREEFIYSVAYLAVYMAVGAGIAIYGSHRIETLRREVAAARRLGQYVLREKLGGGGMGEVYRADHALLRRPAAIKLIRPEKAGDPVHLARFEREVQATATLTHPNTVQIYDYGRADDGTFYCVMEYLPGPTLDQLVRRDGPLPPGRAVHFLRQLCGALREAHAIGLIHRDVKPGNVVVCDRGGVADVAKLLDFGLVRPVGLGRDGEKLTAEGAIFGTPAFMSPEQAEGQDDLDARSDVYSLGCVAYFLLTGRPPFADRSPVKMLAAHLYEQPERLAGVPADLEAVVMRCLAKSPADRFPDVASLDAALAAVTAAAGP